MSLDSEALREQQPAAYDSWAAYYDLTDADRAPFIAFYRGLLTPDTHSLLDLGCGTGTITVAVADQLQRSRTAGTAGTASVIGLDQSLEMVRRARARNSGLRWVVGDLCALPLVGQYDLIIACFNTLQHLLTDRDMERTLGSIRPLLSARGIFAFDIYQPNQAYLSASYTDRMARAIVDGKGRHLEVREDATFDQRSRVLTIDWRLVSLMNPAAEPMAVTRYHLRQYPSAIMNSFLSSAGLVIRARYGDFDRSPFTEASKKQIFVCSA